MKKRIKGIPSLEETACYYKVSFTRRSLGLAPTFHSLVCELPFPLPTPTPSSPSVGTCSEDCIKWPLCFWPLASSLNQSKRSRDRDQREKSKEGCGTGPLAPSLHLWPAVSLGESHGPSLGFFPGCWLLDHSTPPLAQVDRTVIVCSLQYTWVLGTVPSLTSCHTIIPPSALCWEPDTTSLQSLPVFNPGFPLFELRSLPSGESSSAQCHKLGQWIHKSWFHSEKHKVQGGKRNGCLQFLS